MLKSFASAALIAALAQARGKNDGSSSADAFSTTVIDENGLTMVANVWNQFSEDYQEW